MQFLASSSAYLSMVEMGLHLAWTSPSLPHLASENSEFPVSISQGTWIISIPTIVGVIGYIICCLLLNKIGRKYTMIIFAVFHGIAWVIIIYAKSYIYLYIARIFAGIGFGGSYTVSTIYIGEISDKRMRGAMLTLGKISFSVGVLIIAIAGAFLPYKTMNFALLSILIALGASFLLMPETPYFYLLQGKDTKAIKTLMWLRGMKNVEVVMPDIERMKNAVIESRKSKGIQLRELFVKRGTRRGIIIVLIAKAAYVYSGFFPILASTQEILTETGFFLTPSYCAMILGGTQILSGFLATQIIDRFGRRILFLSSGLLSVLALAILGLYFYVKSETNYDLSFFNWLPLITLMVFQFGCNMGIVPVTTVFVGEFFSVESKGPALTVVSIVATCLGFSWKLGFLGLKNSVGIHVSFLTSALICGVGTLIVFLITPETKGKNLEEVQRILDESNCCGSRKKNNRTYCINH